MEENTAANRLLSAYLSSSSSGGAVQLSCFDALFAACLRHTTTNGGAGVSRVLRHPLPSDSAEASALTRWWPTVLTALDTCPSYSPAIDAVMRRAAQLLEASGALLAPGVMLTTTGAARPAKRARKSSSILRLTLSDARRAISTSLHSLPACLPLLSCPEDVLTLLQSLALKAVPDDTPSLAKALTTANQASAASSSTPPEAQCAFALLQHVVGSEQPVEMASALEASGADLALCAQADELIVRLYLQNDERTELLRAPQRLEQARRAFRAGAGSGGSKKSCCGAWWR